MTLRGSWNPISLLRQILQNTEVIMSQGTSGAQALSDLQAAETNTQSQIATLTTALTNGIAALEALITGNATGAVSADAVEAVVTQMKQDAANVSGLTTEINQAVTTEQGGGSSQPSAPTGDVAKKS
jgi:predicted transcriptional regulator